VANRAAEKELSVLALENKKLKKRLVPLEKRRQLDKKAESLLRDIDDFLRQRPRFYSLLNDIADRIPEGTWFSSLVYRKGKLTLRGRSPDALKVVESLSEANPMLGFRGCRLGLIYPEIYEMQVTKNMYAFMTLLKLLKALKVLLSSNSL